MSTASSDSTMDLPDSKNGFMLQLPQRFGAVEENWSALREGDWDQVELEKLYKRLRELSEASSRFELTQLNETVFSLEVYLSSFVGTAERPEENQLDAIDGLVRNLKAAVEASSQALPGETAEQGHSIYLLGNEQGNDAEALQDALTASGATCNLLKDVDSLIKHMTLELPGAIVVDSADLPGLQALSDELVRLKSQLKANIPLIFVSSSGTLQLRVDAIRAGGDAYFVKPFDDREVAQQIIALSSSSKDEPYHVLVVEDDPTQAEFAASILRKANMEVVTVTEPMRVLEKLREFTPDLILMDIYMPDVNGIELTRVIREYNEYVGIPIVFLSGEQNSDKQVDALSVGGDDFVAKPIRPKHLLAVVDNRVRRSRALKHALGQYKTHDRVTGLLTHTRFADQVANALADPAHVQAAGVFAIEADDLDQLQDKLGIGGLDHLMGQLASVLRSAIEPTDAAAKLNDMTFGLLIKRGDRQQIEELAAHLQEQVSEHDFETEQGPLNISIGIGICLLDEHADDATSMIDRSLNALQEAQKTGRSNTRVQTQATQIEEGTPEKTGDVTNIIRRCLAEHSFLVRYQPLLDLQSRHSENYEIILRMPTPSGELLHERDIREPAERAGLASDVDHWILERAIDILKQRRESGRQTQIFVRQSATSLLDANHPAWLLGRLRAQQMVGTGLVLDFRLSDLSKDIKAARKNISALREFDVEVSLSRFPEKPAAFKVLRYVGAQYVNVAPRLLKADQQTISEMIQETHKLGAKVIVANIDDPRSIDLHWSSGADYLQGDFIQRQLDNMDYDFSQVVI